MSPFSPVRGLGSLRLLVVEDSEDDSEITCNSLTNAGFAVQAHRVSERTDFVEALRNQKFDVILADYHVPGFGALQALQSLQETGLDIPFVVVSGIITEEMALDAMRAGAHDFFRKGSLERLPAALEREIKDAKTRAEKARVIQELQRAVAVRDEFLAIASHELKTPITVLALQIQNLKKWIAHHVPAAANEAARRTAIATEQAEHLTTLVERLLAVTEGSSERIPLRPEACNLTDVLQRAIETARLGRSRATSPIDVAAPEMCMAVVDPVRMESVVANLVGNALKFGEGLPVRVTLTTDGTRVRLSVKDRGIGIAKEDHNRIFGRFERAVSHRHYGGFGIGLWLVDQVVKAHQGTIAVRSELGQGAEFIIDIPAQALNASKASAR